MISFLESPSVLKAHVTDVYDGETPGPMQIAKELEKEKLFKVVHDVKDLKNEIENIDNKMISISKRRRNLIINIKNYLSSLGNRK